MHEIRPVQLVKSTLNHTDNMKAGHTNESKSISVILSTRLWLDH